jgi:hypothetical protein
MPEAEVNILFLGSILVSIELKVIVLLYDTFYMLLSPLKYALITTFSLV